MLATKAAPFFTTNHSEAGGGFEPLPEGEYELICSKVEVAQSQNGNDMIKMELTVREDMHPQFKNRKVFNNLVFTDKTHGIIQGALKGFQIPDGTEFKNIGEMAKAFQYKPVRAKLTVEPFTKQDGTTVENNRVKSFKPSEAGNAPTVNADPFAAAGPEITDADLPF